MGDLYLGRSRSELAPGKKPRPCPKKLKHKRTGDVVQVIEHLLSKHKALWLNLSSIKQIPKTKKKKMQNIVLSFQ
jgi:hypothetical protein